MTNSNKKAVCRIVNGVGEIDFVDMTDQEVSALSSSYVTPYDQLRRNEYPQIGDQLDAILKFFDNFDSATLPQDLIDIIDEWKTVKDQYPKPES